MSMMRRQKRFNLSNPYLNKSHSPFEISNTYSICLYCCNCYQCSPYNRICNQKTVVVRYQFRACNLGLFTKNKKTIDLNYKVKGTNSCQKCCKLYLSIIAVVSMFAEFNIVKSSTLLPRTHPYCLEITHFQRCPVPIKIICKSQQR